MMISPSQYMAIRESSLLELRDALRDLRDGSANNNNIDPALFEKIEKIFENAQKNAELFSKPIDNPLKKCVLTPCGSRVIYYMMWAVPVVTVAGIVVQGIDVWQESEAYEECITSHKSYQMMYLQNVTTPLPPLEELCVSKNDLKIATFFASVAIGAVIGGLSWLNNFLGKQVKEFEKMKRQLEQRDLLDINLKTFIQKLRSFDRHRNRQNLDFCLSELYQITNERILSSYGSKEYIISDLINRVDDPEIKSKLEELKNVIARERARAAISPQISPRHNMKRRKVRRPHGERGPTPRDSISDIAPLEVKTENWFKKFTEELKLPPLNYLRVGDVWVSNAGAVSETEKDIAESRRPSESDNPSEPWVIDIDRGSPETD